MSVANVAEGRPHVAVLLQGHETAQSHSKIAVLEILLSGLRDERRFPRKSSVHKSNLQADRPQVQIPAHDHRSGAAVRQSDQTIEHALPRIRCVRPLLRRRTMHIRAQPAEREWLRGLWSAACHHWHRPRAAAQHLGHAEVLVRVDVHLRLTLHFDPGIWTHERHIVAPRVYAPVAHLHLLENPSEPAAQSSWSGMCIAAGAAFCFGKRRLQAHLHLPHLGEAQHVAAKLRERLDDISLQPAEPFFAVLRALERRGLQADIVKSDTAHLIQIRE